MRVFHCAICGSTMHTARNHNGSAPRQSGTTKAQNLWSHYRLEWETYARWLLEGCAVCHRPFECTPDVEHDHACDHPGKGHFSCRACVRGVADRSCNLRVGAFERGLNSDADIAAYLGVSRQPPDVLQLALW